MDASLGLLHLSWILVLASPVARPKPSSISASSVVAVPLMSMGAFGSWMEPIEWLGVVA
jgi:hypothetical protein